MSDVNKSKQQLIQEVKALRRQVDQLKATRIVFSAQHQLFKTYATMMQTASGSLMLRALLQDILHVAGRLTKAEESSLFLLNADGMVTESLLARGATLPRYKKQIIGQVLDQGLAGWVSRHREVGLITDTMDDDRWLTLPGQPYQVRSVLAVPILRGKRLLGIITLMHSQAEHFGAKSARLMEMTAESMALILENAQLHSQQQHLGQQSPQNYQVFSPPNQLTESSDNFSSLGIYIIYSKGDFLYVNPKMAEIFGYSFGELISLQSLLHVVAEDKRKFVDERITNCLQGQGKNLYFTFPAQCKDGSKINVEIYGSRTKLYGKLVIIGALRRLNNLRG
ncbi:GAF domain-containing protein [Moorena sp. SIO2C4]|uniref:PAS domain S-box protein n=1 Tax=Moorena sp. SIO2C4 TaxID=2607824 RepID=UPI00257DD3AB|nr:GAF domain-containing protein [Moorena sp. SIO2C4]